MYVEVRDGKERKRMERMMGVRGEERGCDKKEESRIGRCKQTVKIYWHLYTVVHAAK